MKITNTFEPNSTPAPLSCQHDQVGPLDRELLWTGPCATSYSEVIIAKNNLTVPPLKYDEDSAFIILFALKCEKIVGCPHNIVKYQKRPFWRATQLPKPLMKNTSRTTSPPTKSSRRPQMRPSMIKTKMTISATRMRWAPDDSHPVQ